jgi:hypothetical protein
MNLKLTKLEREILEHRLEVPDCIAEFLEADFDEVYAACQQIAAGEISDSPLVRDILADCVEGSTFCGTMIGAVDDGDVTRAQYRAATRAAHSLARKIGAIVGRQLEPMTV